jgi:hypothetical protein
MQEAAERLAKLRHRVDDAAQAAHQDDGASRVLLAVVEELQRKMEKARGIVEGSTDPGAVREAVVEVEQAADSMKPAAEADDGISPETRQALVESHDRLCVFKTKLEI